MKCPRLTFNVHINHPVTKKPCLKVSFTQNVTLANVIKGGSLTMFQNFTVQVGQK